MGQFDAIYDLKNDDHVQFFMVIRFTIVEYNKFETDSDIKQEINFIEVVA
ncbi:MAG: hypothetical protein CM15mV141_140 [uncultured marine virus]|nr:MAG: hypothetical protein CM15mV141_140 [uncultured marine virus]